MKNLLFYGDSNTWGYDPSNGSRYPYRDRWTTICAEQLGPQYCCIPAGMNGRTTAFDDPLKGCRNGLEGLDYELQSHKPLDLLVLMLGTNDLKYTDAAGSASGMEQLVQKIRSANERFCLSSPVFPAGAAILLVSPILVRGNIREEQSGGEAFDACRESEKIADLYQKIALRNQLDFLDASRVAAPSPVDGIHLERDGHRALGRAMAEHIQRIYK